MSKEERRYIVIGLILAIFGCIAAWLAIPQIQNLLNESDISITPTLPPTRTPSPTRPPVVELRFEAMKVNEPLDNLLLELLEGFQNQYPTKISEPIALSTLDTYALRILEMQEAGDPPDVFALYSSYEAWIGSKQYHITE